MVRASVEGRQEQLDSCGAPRRVILVPRHRGDSEAERPGPWSVWRVAADGSTAGASVPDRGSSTTEMVPGPSPSYMESEPSHWAAQVELSPSADEGLAGSLALGGEAAGVERPTDAPASSEGLGDGAKCHVEVDCGPLTPQPPRRVRTRDPAAEHLSALRSHA